jgi:hypothetical protein
MKKYIMVMVCNASVLCAVDVTKVASGKRLCLDTEKNKT